VQRNTRCGFPCRARNQSGTPEFIIGREGEHLMPVLLIPVLWVAGSAIVLGGGYFIIAHAVH
jgi:hypothetical protein